MNFLVLITLLCFLSAFANAGPVDNPSDDPSYCQYWIERFSDIGFWEIQRAEDVPKILATEGLDRAVDFDIVLRERIRAVMIQIKRDGE